MFRLKTDYRFKTSLLITLSALAAWTAACSETQPSVGNSSASSAPAGSSAAPGGGQFEGVIAMKVDPVNQKKMELTYFIKGRQARVETKIVDTGHSWVMLIDLEAGKITTLTPANKTYFTSDLEESAEDSSETVGKTTQAQGDDLETKFPKLTPTGRQETVAGYTCEHWLIGEKQELDACMAKGFGFFGVGDLVGMGRLYKGETFDPKFLAEAATHPGWAKFIEGGAFPLKATVAVMGKTRLTMEAANIQREPLPDSLFTIPPDYKDSTAPGH